ncbi:hypothetical protein A2U01_0058906, partial [Trifolium medium]|nr:hypothetical protein [Trifolium medium]
RNICPQVIAMEHNEDSNLQQAETALENMKSNAALGRRKDEMNHRPMKTCLNVFSFC